MSEKVWKYKYKDEAVHETIDGEMFIKNLHDTPRTAQVRYNKTEDCFYVYSDDVLPDLELVGENETWP